MLLVICFCFRSLFPPSKIVYETHLSIDFTTHDHTSLSYSSTLLIQDPRLKFIESRKKESQDLNIFMRHKTAEKF